ncbi:MAG: hypothetical protein K8J31_04800 [Anaerolineae bacterium]|nr:hypothetical protein [Anaerolineae bacterium]
MNTHKRLLIGILALLGALWLPLSMTVAQDHNLSEIFTFESGVSFRYPTGAQLRTDERLPALVGVVVKGTPIFVIDHPLFAAEDFTAATSLSDAAAWYVETLLDLDFDADMVEPSKIDGREALRYPYNYEGDDTLLILIRFENGTFGALDAPASEESLAAAIAVSFDQSSESEAVSGATCIIRTADAKTVQLRVGPGTNRTAYAFLPAKEDFIPLGQAEAADGSLWFQLDKDEAAPQSAASEAWVAADAVETSGDCTHIGAASAPPIVPIIPAAPPASSGGDSGSSGGGSASIAPSPGTWTITYARTGKGSCLDAASFTYDFPVDWSPDVVSLSYTGSTVILSGSRMNQVQPGVYSGVFTLANGNALQFTIRPVSSTLFTGQAQLTGVVEGHTCSNTIDLTISRN